jgi:hypothetical protein
LLAQSLARAVSPTERPECVGAPFAATDRVSARMAVAAVRIIVEMLIWGDRCVD